MKRIFLAIVVLITLAFLLGVIAFAGYYVYNKMKGEKGKQGERQKSVCGDGVCDDIVCAGINCPLPENRENCPKDCK